MKLGILILAGGKSSRMNYHDKASLRLNNTTFLEKIASEFREDTNKYLSINPNQSYQIAGFTNVLDEYEAIGPMGGIVSAFHQSDVDAFFVISCDMPFFKHQLLDLLLERLEDSEGIFVEDDLHQYPTLGIYTKKLLPILEEAIQFQKYGLYRAIKQRNIQWIHIDSLKLNPKILKNINTIKDYEELCQ